MKNYQNLLMAIAAMGCLACNKEKAARVAPQQTAAGPGLELTTVHSYTNPLISTDPGTSDPQLMQGFDGAFYSYYPDNSGTGSRYAVYKSTDMVHWSLASGNVFSTSNTFWSAGTYKMGTTYYLYYTEVTSTTKYIGVATSSSPLGPFTNRGLILNTGPSDKVIDPYVIKDPVSGNLYIYYSHNEDELRVKQLAADGLSTVGAHTVILALSDPGYQAWEYINIEHPMVFYAPNASSSHRFYLLYNGAGGDLARYAIGYAYSSSATGPFTRATAGTADGQNPLVHRDDAHGIYGPGAPNTVVDNANPGIRWLFYRIKTTAGQAWADRVTCIDKLDRNGSDQLIIHPTYQTTVAAGPNF